MLSRSQKANFVVLFAIFLVAWCVPDLCAQSSDSEQVEMYFFYSMSCPHCADEKAFLESIEDNYPGLRINYFESSENWELFNSMCQNYNTSSAGVPRTFIGDKVFIGFERNDCDPVWYESYSAYMGCPNQIEIEMRGLLNLTEVISKSDALEISKRTPEVIALRSECSDTLSNVLAKGGRYYVSWWSTDRVKSDLNYPNVLVVLDETEGVVLNISVPVASVGLEGIVKPDLPGTNYTILIITILICIVLMAFMVVGSKVPTRYWVSILSLLAILLLYAFFDSLPSMNVVAYAKGFSFPIFTAIIALVDGFNPCAFAVLAFLLSILTHTKSRKKMLFIGSIFIITSGLMYSLFILVLLFLRVELLGGYKEIIRLIVALIAGVAGLINIKDFFFFKQGISLTMSSEKQGNIFKKAGKLVRRVEKADNTHDLILAGFTTIILAVMVNLVELGCTFILPMQYIETLIVNYPENSLAYVLFTLIYGAVYVIPLFVILGSFVYSFKSGRMNETQGRVLKLIGGLIMVSLSVILLLRPELLMFG